MKDFLIILYLAFTLFMTLTELTYLSDRCGNTAYKSSDHYHPYIMTIVAILWSIWYVYIIH